MGWKQDKARAQKDPQANAPWGKGPGRIPNPTLERNRPKAPRGGGLQPATEAKHPASNADRTALGGAFDVEERRKGLKERAKQAALKARSRVECPIDPSPVSGGPLKVRVVSVKEMLAKEDPTRWKSKATLKAEARATELAEIRAHLLMEGVDEKKIDSMALDIWVKREQARTVNHAP